MSNKNIDLKFIPDMIDSHIKGYKMDLDEGLIDNSEYYYRIDSLKNLKNALQDFIEEANNVNK